MSKRVLFKSVAPLSVFAMISVLMLTLAVTAFELEHVKTWYWTGDTGIYSVAVDDVDGDDSVEIVTGGICSDGLRNNGQLCVWDGATLALKKVQTWYWGSGTGVLSVAVGDVDGEDSNEIVTGGSFFDGTRANAQLCIWSGSILALENVKTWYWASNTEIDSVLVGDVDYDESIEIITGGYHYDNTRDNAQLCVWSGSSLALEDVTTWYWTGSTGIHSLAVGFDDFIEIVTGGWFWDGERNNAQLAVWG